MKRTGIALLCLLLLTGCGRAQRAEEAQAYYAGLGAVELEAQVDCRTGEEVRSFTVRCSRGAEGDSTVTVLDPPELAGLTAQVSGEDLTLRWGDLALSMPGGAAVSPAECLPLLLRAAAEGYVLEEGRETLEGVPCLRLGLDVTGGEGETLLCALWLREADHAPVYAEFTAGEQLTLSVRVTSFAAGAAGGKG